MTSTVSHSILSKGARLAPLLLLSVATAAALVTMLRMGTKLRTGCTDVLIKSTIRSNSQNAGSHFGGNQDGNSQAVAPARYRSIQEHSVCRFFRVAWNQGQETMWLGGYPQPDCLFMLPRGMIAADSAPTAAVAATRSANNLCWGAASAQAVANSVWGRMRRGPWNLCDLEVPGAWLQRALSNCYSCLDPSRNVCRQPRRLIYNQYLVGLHPLSWKANLLSIQAFLMTQDLRRARLVLWADDPTAVYNNNTAYFFDAFSDHITIKRFDYSKEVVGTPWEGHDFFGNGSLIRSFMPMPGSWSDIVRLMLLHKYGHFWMDNDVVFFKDVSHLLDTCYQFVTRWTNLHVMRMDPGSRLSHRAMQTALRLPLNHPNFTGEVIEKLCKPNGYIPAHPMYNNTDVYNTCLFRMLIRNNNTGPPDAVPYDFPLGWWDHDWANCFQIRKEINDTHWRKVASSTLAMHNRHPGSNPKEVNSLGPETPPSPLWRVIKIVEDFFQQCSSPVRLPPDGMPLLAYEGFGNASFVHSRRMRALLRWQQG